MASFNKVILLGNLTRDPQVRYTAGGTAVADLGMAVNRTWFDKQANQRREEVTFVDITLWGRQAEIAGEYLSKGRSVLIEGYLKLDQWDDKKTGEKRSRLQVVAESMTMVGGRSDGGGDPGPGRGSQGSRGRATGGRPPQEDSASAESFYDNSAPEDIPDGDVPF